jgi:GTP diphosphokinase / guanosine-3',5'-bis(diphosphate) 3'-diphosphatase
MAEETQDKGLVERARDFAIQADKSRNHRRKHTDAPYSVHLQNVVDLVAAVTDKTEVLAPAWLPDVVEDTAPTSEDVEASFGKSVPYMVDCRTDV